MINNMKNIIKTAALSALLVTFAMSCNDEFLERYPLDSISDPTFWKSAANVRQYANNWYNYGGSTYDKSLLSQYKAYNMGPFQNDACLGFGEGDATRGIGSDIQVYPSYNRRLNGEQVQSGDNRSYWTQDDWTFLRSVNHFLDWYTACTAPFDEIKQYVGEALFFHAFFYFDKLTKFGDLPWANSEMTPGSDVLYAPRTPRNEIVEKILEELDLAVTYLNAQAGGAWTGRITKETGLALQARIALYEGTWEKYHAGTPFGAAVNQSQKFLQKAADAAGALIAMEESVGYPALDNMGEPDGYRNLFNRVGNEYANSKEALFWRRAEVGSWTGHWCVLSHIAGSTGAGGASATKNMIDSYLKLDGTPVVPGYDDATLVKVAEGRDPRLVQTICVDDGQHHRWELASPATYFVAPQFEGNTCPTGYQIYKGHDSRVAAQPGGWNNDGGLNGLIYFRYGETLLIYAEAKAELGNGTISQSDLDRSINKLRRRVVGMADMTTSVAIDPNFEFSSLSPIIQAIRRERKVELAFEGFRPDDIMRWAAAGELIVDQTPLGAKKAQWEGFKFADCTYDQSQNDRQSAFDLEVENLVTDANGYIKPFADRMNGGTAGFKFNINRDYLLPIPQAQLTLNPQMEQNPGWPKQ